MIIIYNKFILFILQPYIMPPINVETWTSTVQIPINKANAANITTAELDTILQSKWLPTTKAIKKLQTKVADDAHMAVSAKEKQPTIPTTFIQLCQKSEAYNSKNEVAAKQAMKLVENGSVTFSKWKVNFHSINGIAINKSLLEKTYKLPVDEEHSIKERNTWIDLLGKEHGKNDIWFEQWYLDDVKHVQAIRKDLKNKSQYLALYENFFGKIYDALKGDAYTRWRTIQLLTNINDRTILDTERNDNDTRRFLKLDEFIAHMHFFIHDFSSGSLRVVKDCS